MLLWSLSYKYLLLTKLASNLQRFPYLCLFFHLKLHSPCSASLLGPWRHLLPCWEKPEAAARGRSWSSAPASVTVDVRLKKKSFLAAKMINSFGRTFEHTGRAKESGQKIIPFKSFSLRCHQKVPPVFMVGLPVSNSLSKEVPHSNTQQVVF